MLLLHAFLRLQLIAGDNAYQSGQQMIVVYQLRLTATPQESGRKVKFNTCLTPRRKTNEYAIGTIKMKLLSINVNCNYARTILREHLVWLVNYIIS